MTIYRLKADHESYMVFTLKPDELYAKMGEDFLYHIDRTPQKQENWVAPNITFRIPQGYANANKIPDLTDWVNSHLVLNQKAYQILSGYLGSYGEFLPVFCEGIPYYIYNVLKLIDESAIDTENSERKMEGGIQTGLKKLKFKEDQLKYVDIFKTEYDTFLNVFCSDEFKQQVESAGLKGLNFTEDLSGIF